MLRDSPRPVAAAAAAPGTSVTAAVACLVVAAPVALAVRLGTDAPVERARAGGRPRLGGVARAGDRLAHRRVVAGGRRDRARARRAGRRRPHRDAERVVGVRRRPHPRARRRASTAPRSRSASRRPSPHPGGRLQVLEGGGAVYVLDPERRTASRADPRTLEAGTELSLAAQPGDGQAVVDDAGRLWVVDSTTGSLTWFDDAKHVDDDLSSSPVAQLVLVQGQAVLVDVAGGRAVRARSGRSARGGWSCAGLPPGSSARLLGSLSSDHVYAAVPADGTLRRRGASGATTAGPPIPLAEPGTADFGPLAQDGRYVFVPDRTTGTTSVVDTVRGALVADLPAGPRRATGSSSPRRTASCSTTTSTPRSPGCITLDGGTRGAGTPGRRSTTRRPTRASRSSARGRRRPHGADPRDQRGRCGPPCAPVRDGRTRRGRPDRPRSAAGPVIAGLDVRPDPVVLGSPVRSTPRSAGRPGTTWEWTLTAAGRSVAWSSDRPGAVDATIAGRRPRRRTAHARRRRRRRAPGDARARPLDTVLVPTPHIESFQRRRPDARPGRGREHLRRRVRAVRRAESTWQWDGRRWTGSPCRSRAARTGRAAPAAVPVRGRVHRHAHDHERRAVRHGVRPRSPTPTSASPRWPTAGSSTCGESGTATVDVTADDCFVDSADHARAAAVAVQPHADRRRRRPGRPRRSTGASAALRARPGAGRAHGRRHATVRRPGHRGGHPGARGPARPVDVRVNLPPRGPDDPECTPPTRPRATGPVRRRRSPTPTRARSTSG